MNASVGLALRVMIFGALYLFLGFAIWTLWRTVSAHRVQSGTLPVPVIRLTAESEEKEKHAAFSSAEVLIGRDSESDFVLRDPTVSSRHGRLSFRQNQWWYEDLRSRNGSFLEDLRIEEPIVLKDGDTIYCGDARISIQIQSDEK